jgi:hypothetical protein
VESTNDNTLIVAILQLLANLILVGVTAWYAWQTKKQAISSAAQAEHMQTQIEQMKEAAKFNAEQAASARETIGLSTEQLKSLQETVRLSTEQLQFTKETIKAEHQQYVEALAAFVDGLYDIVCVKFSEQMPLPGREYKEFYLLHENDLTELLLLSRNVGGEVTRLAVKAAIPLRVMYALARGAHERQDKISITEDEKKAWDRARQDAGRELNDLRDKLRGL